MAELKTKATKASVAEFIARIADKQQQADSKAVLEIMERIAGTKPKMWGPSIVGFVDTRLTYDSGRELDWFKIGFSPRKQYLTLYVLKGGAEEWGDLLNKLGKHTTGKGCLYIKKLTDVDTEVLEEIIAKSLTY